MHPKVNYVRNAIKIDFISFIYEKKIQAPYSFSLFSPCICDIFSSTFLSRIK